MLRDPHACQWESLWHVGEYDGSGCESYRVYLVTVSNHVSQNMAQDNIYKYCVTDNFQANHFLVFCMSIRQMLSVSWLAPTEMSRTHQT